jgi:hypothetical protein
MLLLLFVRPNAIDELDIVIRYSEIIVLATTWAIGLCMYGKDVFVPPSRKGFIF